MKNFVCVVIDTKQERCLGVDFCKDLEALRRRADIYRSDIGPECIVIEHPSREAEALDAIDRELQRMADEIED